MPLITEAFNPDKGPWKLKRPPKVVEDDGLYWVNLFTREVFSSYESYVVRMELYESRIWSCRLTGTSNLTYQEALKSEAEHMYYVNTFPETLMPVFLEMVHGASQHLDVLVTIVTNRLRWLFYPGEQVKFRGRYMSVKHAVDWEDDRPKGKFPEYGQVYCVEWVDGKGKPREQEVEGKRLLREVPLTNHVVRCVIRNEAFRPKIKGAPWLVSEQAMRKYNIRKPLPPDVLELLHEYEERESRKRKRAFDDTTDEEEAREEEEARRRRHRERQEKAQKARARKKQKKAEPYPWEDLKLLRLERKVKPAFPMFSVHPNNEVTGERLVSILTLWRFFDYFGKPLQLSPFTFEDFCDAVCHDGECTLISEVFMTGLRLLLPLATVHEGNWEDVIVRYFHPHHETVAVNGSYPPPSGPAMANGGSPSAIVGASGGSEGGGPDQANGPTGTPEETTDRPTEKDNAMDTSRGGGDGDGPGGEGGNGSCQDGSDDERSAGGKSSVDTVKQRLPSPQDEERAQLVVALQEKEKWSALSLDEKIRSISLLTEDLLNPSLVPTLRTFVDGELERKVRLSKEKWQETRKMVGNVKRLDGDIREEQMGIPENYDEDNVETTMSREDSRAAAAKLKTIKKLEVTLRFQKQLIDKKSEKYDRQMEKCVIRDSPIGTDRWYNRYWYFPDIPDKLFVESSPYFSCNTQAEFQTLVESNDELSEAVFALPKRGSAQMEMHYYDTKEQLNQLFECLNSNGVRERKLLKRINDVYYKISANISKKQSVAVRETAERSGAVRRSGRRKPKEPVQTDVALTGFLAYVNKANR